MSRDAVFAALFSLLQALPGAVTVSRRLRMWSDVDQTEQPAVFLASGAQVPTQSPAGHPAVWRLSASVYLYAKTSDPNIAPSTILNDLLDALEGVLAPGFPGQKQTLGGLCQHCWISGQVETDEGILGDQAMAIVPIEILL